MTWGTILVAAATLLAGDGALTVRIPIDEGGEIDVAELVARLAEEAGLDMKRPATSLRLPIRGVGGSLARTLLADSLGPDATLEVGPRALVVRLKKGADRRLKARLDA